MARTFEACWSLLAQKGRGEALEMCSEVESGQEDPKGGQVFFCVRFALARYDTLVTTMDEFDYIAKFLCFLTSIDSPFFME